MRNFRRWLLLFTTVVVANGFAASVEWDYLQMTGGDDFSPNTYRIGFSPYLVLHKTDTGAENAISLVADNGTYMEFGSVVGIAMSGDMVSASYFEGMDSYFYYGLVSKDGGDIARTDCKLTLGRGDSVFLAFATTLVDDVENYYYGWLELGVAEDGKLVLHHSALGLDGQEMTVGAIPEPSATVLLLVGFAALLLRRDDRGRSELDTSNCRIKIRPRTLA